MLESFASFHFHSTSLDFTKDENVWACTVGLFACGLYRSGMDQMVLQRYLAARTLGEAQRYGARYNR